MKNPDIIHEFSEHLFWDVNRSKMRFEESQLFMVQRVLEYGLMEDWILLKNLLGIDKIAELAKQLRCLDDISLNFISVISGIPKEEFRCFKVLTERTLELLTQIQSEKLFSNLRLVGGTALALLYGHRKSIDLDFFGEIDASNEEIMDKLSSFGKVITLKNSRAIKIYTVNGVKVDFVHYNYSWIEAPVRQNNLLLADDKDIAAMKISAITGRGSKKDFIDLYFLLQKYSLKEIVHFFTDKYPDGSTYLVLKSLVYFDDAEQQEFPEMFENVSWADIKQRILTAHKDFMNNQ